MAPFPEAEIMTIKRLEVALRKMDFKLLKDGAYKLHEKYHGGHRFEYLDLLKDIYIEISNNPSIPDDVKDILAPTIEDILSQGGIQADTATSPSESLNSQEVIEPLEKRLEANNLTDNKVALEIISLLENNTLTVDELMDKSELDSNEIAKMATKLEVYGIVRKNHGNRIELILENQNN